LIIQVSVSSLAYAVIIIIAIILGLHIWKRRAMPGGVYFSLLMAAIGFWALMCMGENEVKATLLRNICIIMQYVAVTWAGPIWLLFVLDYGYRNRWPITRKVQWIWALPFITMVLAVTNQWHGLIWYRSPEDLIIFGHGIGLWANLIYTYALLLIGFILLIWAVIGSYRKNYLRTAMLLVGAMIPVVSSILYMVGLDPDIVGEITPFALGATIIIYAWGIFGLRLFDLVPVAREALVRSMADGVIVLDKKGEIVDMNPAAMRMFDAIDAPIGQPMGVVLSRWPQLIQICRGMNEGSSETLITGNKGSIWIDIRVSALYNHPGKSDGKLVFLRDITMRKLSEEAINQSNDSLRAEVTERKQIEEALNRSNEALQAEISVRKQAEVSLEFSLKEKELLLKEIHHRVKNNLQIISSLLSLQTVTSTHADTSTILKESQNRIKSMALIHEKLYGSRDLARVDFRGYVQSLIASLMRSYVLYPIPTIEVDIEDVSLDIDTAIPCGLIINELISNSLKYAFMSGKVGTLRVSLAQEGDMYHLSVSDDGVGLPPGFDFRNTSSLGLQLVVTLAEQLNGTIEHPDDNGTTFIIRFKEESKAA